MESDDAAEISARAGDCDDEYERRETSGPYALMEGWRPSAARTIARFGGCDCLRSDGMRVSRCDNCADDVRCTTAVQSAEEEVEKLEGSRESWARVWEVRAGGLSFGGFGGSGGFGNRCCSSSVGAQ